MKTTHLFFGIVAVLVIVLGITFLSIETTMTGETTQEIATEQSVPTMETYTVTTEANVDKNAAEKTTSEIDKEKELEYLYVKVQTIQSALSDLESRYRNGEDVSNDLGGVKADINDMEENLYDVFDMLDQTEIDQFQEELDNARERVSSLK